MANIVNRWTRRVFIALFVAVAIVAIFLSSIIVLISLDIYFNETVGRDARRRIYSDAAPDNPTKQDEDLDTR